MPKEPRYRVTDKRDYIEFPDGTRVEAGNLIPKDVEVEKWLVDKGWVVEE
jgi:hypothetical protein